MKRILATLIFSLGLAVSTYATDYYAATNGSGSTCSIGSPCSLHTLLADTAKCNANTFWLRGGTYYGKFLSSLDGCTVRSYCASLSGGCAANPSEWAILDGLKSTTLSSDINSSTTSVTVASATGLVTGSTIAIDTEYMSITNVSGNTLTVLRGWAPNIGGAVAHSGGATVYHGGEVLRVDGSNSTYRDFEITSSYTNRDIEPGAVSGEGCCGFYTKIRGSGIHSPAGSGNSYINLVIHDVLDGFFIGSSSSNTLIYGALTYNNGMHYLSDGNERGSGNGMYLENSSGYSRVYEVLSLNNFNHGAQYFGVSGPYVGGDTQGSVFANSSAPLGNKEHNLIYGPEASQSATGSVTESHFYHEPNTSSYSVHFGYSAGVVTGTFTDSYFYGAGTAFEASNATNLTFTGNKFYSSGASDRYILTANSGYTWNNNTYYNTTTQNRFNDGNNNLNFTNWKAAFGYDASSTATGSALPDTVIIRPNDYETGRANIIIYTTGSPTTININLAMSGLVHGQGYTIKNAFNWNGSDVATGTYDAGNPTISVPLDGAAATVAVPVGVGDGEVVTPATTAPNFIVLVVLPTSAQGATVPAKMGGAIKLSGAIKLQ